MEDLKKYIQTITGFSEQSWSDLLECTTQLDLKKNNKLLKEGEVCNALFFIIKGFCKSVYNKDGKEINTAFHFENDFVTNIRSLKTSSTSEYSIIACERMVVLKLDKAKLLQAYKKSHQIETFGRKVLETIVAQQEAHLTTFKLLTPRERFYNLIEKHPDILQRESLTQIASYLGVSRETLSRLRAER